MYKIYTDSVACVANLCIVSCVADKYDIYIF